jgi:prepilin-type N-terminal cleavage/methylation domain-containing protein/prepilin-type processing-associated H-X9-DG protein
MKLARQRGFTLIELLIVITIMAILSAILMPVFHQAREKARSSACLSNCRQIALAQVQYAQDYDEGLIPLWSFGGSGIPRTNVPERLKHVWVNKLQPYVKNQQVFFDPGFNEAARKKAMEMPDCFGAGMANGFSPPNQYISHYGIAGFGTGGACTQQNPYYAYAGSINFSIVSLSQIQRPAETANIGDSTGTVLLNPPYAAGAIGNTLGCTAAFSHHEGGNFVFLDGHAKWIKGNIERYLAQDASGCWYEKFLTYDR